MDYQRHSLTQAEITLLFAGPADPDWETDGDLIDQGLRDPWDTRESALARHEPWWYLGRRLMVEGWIMSLNIKNAETHQLVQELAALTGESQTMAVTVAVRERLERVRRLRETGLADRLLAIGQDTAPRLREPFRSADHGDLLYDEHGLPA
jgi:antitoxin VapB